MQVSVRTPCRLHFGLLDLNGELGRINGSFGVALERPGWHIQGSDPSGSYEIETPNAPTFNAETLLALEKFNKYFGTKIKHPTFKIIDSLPSHVGLGSKTQFLLAIGTILSKFHGIKTSEREIAKAVQRGGTSGIGVAAFEAGGIILDGGHSFGSGKQKNSFLPSSASKAPPPPVIFRNYPPKEWQFVIFCPANGKGPFGEEEIQLFRTECPIPSEDVEKLSRLILMKILPALVEKDIKTFGEGLTEMQINFKRFGFDRYDEDFMRDFLQSMRNSKDVHGTGISSFGPTMFALTENEKKAIKVIKEIKENYSKTDFEFIDFSPVNTSGAKINIRMMVSED